MDAGSSMVSLLNRSEIDQQIATAHRFPRSVKRFRDEAMAMVTLNESVAGQCIYALPRDGKTIEGPSARFAEVIASAWDSFGLRGCVERNQAAAAGAASSIFV